MESSTSRKAYSIVPPKSLPTPRPSVLDTTPSKRKESPLIDQLLSDVKSSSAPNLPLPGGRANSSSDLPKRLNTHKRAKSASGQSPGTSATKFYDHTGSPRSATPGSCKKEPNHYKRPGFKLRHVDSCPDPECKILSSWLQEQVSNDQEAHPHTDQEQRGDDVFTDGFAKSSTMSTEGITLSGAQIGQGSVSQKTRECPIVEAFEETGEPHSGSSEPMPDPNEIPQQSGEEASEQDRRFEPSSEASSGDLSDDNSADIPTMHQKLRTKFESTLPAGEEEGQVYVMRDLNRPHLLKIGRSKNSEDRAAALKSVCNVNPKFLHERQVRFYKRTEHLVQAYLRDFCRVYTCETCGRTHGEWFEISEELAKATVNKWADFMCREKPYDEGTHELTSFWASRRKGHGIASADIPGVDGFRRQWDAFMSPSELDHLRFKVRSVYEILWKFFWPVYATLAWTVTFAVFQDSLIFFLMAASVLGTFGSMTHEIHSIRHAAARIGKRKILRGGAT